MASSSQLTRKRDDYEEVTRRLRPRKTTTVVSSPSGSQIKWSKSDELLILEGILDYQSETKRSYSSYWDAFYGDTKCFVPQKFSKEQLQNKVKKLRNRFKDNLAKSHDGKAPSFTNTDEDQIFKLSMLIWGQGNETGCASNADQPKVVADVVHGEKINDNVEEAKEDLTHVDHDEQINDHVEKAMDLTHVEQVMDSTNMEHEPSNENIVQTKVNNGQNKKKKKVCENEKEKVGVEEFRLLQEAFEAISVPGLGNTYHKLLLQDLKNLEAAKGKELSEEWKALVDELLKLHIKIQAYSPKLANALVSP